MVIQTSEGRGRKPPAAVGRQQAPVATYRCAVGKRTPEQEQVVSLLWYGILASSIAIMISGGALVTFVVHDELPDDYLHVGVGLAVLSCLPIVHKCLALRPLTSKTIATKDVAAAKPVNKRCHKTTKHDDNTQDTRSTSSSSLYSNSFRHHRRNNTASSNDGEFLKTIRAQQSVLDCQTYSSDDDGERFMDAPHDETPKEVTVDTSRDDVEALTTEKVAEEDKMWRKQVVRDTIHTTKVEVSKDFTVNINKRAEVMTTDKPKADEIMLYYQIDRNTEAPCDETPKKVTINTPKRVEDVTAKKPLKDISICPEQVGTYIETPTEVAVNKVASRDEKPKETTVDPPYEVKAVGAEKPVKEVMMRPEQVVRDMNATQNDANRKVPDDTTKENETVTAMKPKEVKKCRDQVVRDSQVTQDENTKVYTIDTSKEFEALKAERNAEEVRVATQKHNTTRVTIKTCKEIEERAAENPAQGIRDMEATQKETPKEVTFDSSNKVAMVTAASPPEKEKKEIDQGIRNMEVAHDKTPKEVTVDTSKEADVGVAANPPGEAKTRLHHLVVRDTAAICEETPKMLTVGTSNEAEATIADTPAEEVRMWLDQVVRDVELNLDETLRTVTIDRSKKDGVEKAGKHAEDVQMWLDQVVRDMGGTQDEEPKYVSLDRSKEVKMVRSEKHAEDVKLWLDQVARAMETTKDDVYKSDTVSTSKKVEDVTPEKPEEEEEKEEEQEQVDEDPKTWRDQEVTEMVETPKEFVVNASAVGKAFTSSEKPVDRVRTCLDEVVRNTESTLDETSKEITVDTSKEAKVVKPAEAVRMLLDQVVRDTDVLQDQKISVGASKEVEAVTADKPADETKIWLDQVDKDLEAIQDEAFSVDTLEEVDAVTPKKPAEKAEKWLDQVVIDDHVSSSSSLGESRHPLSPTGYISLKAFSSLSLGAEMEITDSEKANWETGAKEEEPEDDEIALNPTVQYNVSFSSTFTNQEGASSTPEGTMSAKDALSAMLEETISKMEESSKRMRNALAERVQTLSQSTRTKLSDQPLLTIVDSRDDINFDRLVSSACGTLNLALHPCAQKREHYELEDEERIAAPPDTPEFSASPYPLTGSVPRLSSVQMPRRAEKNLMSGQLLDEFMRTNRVKGTVVIQPEMKQEGSNHVRCCVLPLLSAPYDERQQNAQFENEEESVFLARVTEETDSTVPEKASKNDEPYFLSITQSLSMSFQNLDFRRTVQCHGGIESVAPCS